MCTLRIRPRGHRNSRWVWECVRFCLTGTRCVRCVRCARCVPAPWVNIFCTWLHNSCQPCAIVAHECVPSAKSQRTQPAQVLPPENPCKSCANITSLPWSAGVAAASICKSRTKRSAKCTLRLITEDARFFIIKRGYGWVLVTKKREKNLGPGWNCGNYVWGGKERKGEKSFPLGERALSGKTFESGGRSARTHE